MRAKYYALTLRQMKLKKSFVFFLIFFLLIFFVLNIFVKNIEPTINKICENNARSIAIKCSNEAVYKNIEDVSYEDLIKINKDESGKVTSLSANSVQINKINTKIISDMEKKLQDNYESKIKIPIGMFFDQNIISRIWARY